MSTQKAITRQRPDGYGSWINIITRCGNPKNEHYHRYGGRGIGICDRWRKSFDAFIQDMGPRPSKTHSVDRINNDGHYEPGNCRWVTQREQMRNTSYNTLLTYDGVTKSLPEWAEEKGIPYSTLRQRINRLKWPAEKALHAAVRPLRSKPAEG